MKGLHAVHAIFKNGALIFADPTLAPQDGTEVVVTYFEALPAGKRKWGQRIIP